jgi:hypothetical protein
MAQKRHRPESGLPKQLNSLQSSTTFAFHSEHGDRMSKKMLLGLLFFSLGHAIPALAKVSCSNLYGPFPGSEAPADPLLHADLLQLQREEVRGQTPDQITQMNQKTLADLTNTDFGRPAAGRVAGLTSDQIKNVILSMGKLPLFIEASAGLYNQPGVNIGYCFGRAAYAHLALLKMGVDKNSIRKAWIVGPMKSGGTSWQFHVATLVRGVDQKWYALDNYFGGRVLEIGQWAVAFNNQNAERNLRLYITNPQKFSIELSRYDRLQMGLDLDPANDWYKGFFQKLMLWFHEGKLADVGLSRMI